MSQSPRHNENEHAKTTEVIFYNMSIVCVRTHSMLVYFNNIYIISIQYMRRIGRAWYFFRTPSRSPDRHTPEDLSFRVCVCECFRRYDDGMLPDLWLFIMSYNYAWLGRFALALFSCINMICVFLSSILLCAMFNGFFFFFGCVVVWW